MAKDGAPREYVVPHPLGWAVRHGDTEEFHFTTKKDAVQKARSLAKAHRTELIIQDLEGRIQNRHDYS